MNDVHSGMIVSLLEDIDFKFESLLHGHAEVKEEVCSCQCKNETPCAGSGESVSMFVDFKSAQECRDHCVYWKDEFKRVVNERNSALDRATLAEQHRDFADGVATGLIQKENELRESLARANEKANRFDAQLTITMKRAEISEEKFDLARKEANRKINIVEKQFNLAVKDFVEVSNELDAVKNGIKEGSRHLRDKVSALETELDIVKSNRDCLIKKCDMLQVMYDKERKERIRLE